MPFITDIMSGLFRRGNSSAAPVQPQSPTIPGAVSRNSSLPYSPWNILYSPNMPAQMTPGAGGTFYFDFPVLDGVHYVVKSQLQPLGIGQRVTMNFALEGSGQIMPTQGDPPAKVRLFIQRQGDNLSGAGDYEYFRWWSTAAADLIVPQEYSLTAEIRPENWTSVYGKSGSLVPQNFADALANVAVVGVTFGGMFAGHGDYVTGGAARFVLRNYSVG